MSHYITLLQKLFCFKKVLRSSMFFPTRYIDRLKKKFDIRYVLNMINQKYVKRSATVNDRHFWELIPSPANRHFKYLHYKCSAVPIMLSAKYPPCIFLAELDIHFRSMESLICLQGGVNMLRASVKYSGYLDI